MIRKNEDEVSENIIKNEEIAKNDSKTKWPKSRKKRIVRWISFVCFVLLGLWLLYGNVSLQTTVYEIQVGEEYSDLGGFTIVQISDLHNDEFGKDNERLLALIKEIKPLLKYYRGKDEKSFYQIYCAALCMDCIMNEVRGCKDKRKRRENIREIRQSELYPFLKLKWGLRIQGTKMKIKFLITWGLTKFRLV